MVLTRERKKYVYLVGDTIQSIAPGYGGLGETERHIPTYGPSSSSHQGHVPLVISYDPTGKDSTLKIEVICSQILSHLGKIKLACLPTQLQLIIISNCGQYVCA